MHEVKTRIAPSKGTGTVILENDPSAPSGTGTVILTTDPEATVRPGTVILRQGTGTVILDAGNGQKQNIPIPDLGIQIDERTDIYSVGATLYALLTGTAPNADFTKVVPIRTIMPNASEGLLTLIETSMQYLPENRYKNATEFKNAVLSIAKVDKRYKNLVKRQNVGIVLSIFGIALGIILIILGMQQNETGNAEAYEAIVDQMETIQEDGTATESEIERLYAEALGYRTDDAGAYYQKATFLYYSLRFEDVISFLENEVLIQSTFDDEEMEKIYALYANSLMELDQVDTAISYYRTAINYYAYDADCYSNFAIALARTNQLDEAEKTLEQATQLGLASDRILLAQGEILGRKGNVNEAADAFRQCVATTDDSYVQVRAYVMWAKIYEEKDATEEGLSAAREVLLQAEENVSEEYDSMIQELLAQNYIDMGDVTGSSAEYEAAINCLNQVVKNGWDTYTTHNNIGVLYQTIGNYSAASEEFSNMLTTYGEDYRTYKRLAFLEVDIQNAKANASRSYGTFVNYYNQAKSLFENSGYRGDSDMEMQLLDQVYQQLIDGNWITG